MEAPENICKFAQTMLPQHDLHILNFVYEHTAECPQRMITPAGYTMHMAAAGRGVLHTACGDFAIAAGDLFLTFSARPYCIENTGGLEYIYIGFIGTRAEALLERAQLVCTQPVRHGFAFLAERWAREIVRAAPCSIDLICESLLMEAFSYLCASAAESAQGAADSGILRIKQYTDLHYTDASLNLAAVSRMHHYSAKYVSAAFVRLVRVPYSEYLQGLRIRHACVLLRSGACSVQEAAAASGFRDPLYFSKVFRHRCGVAPRDFRAHEAAKAGQSASSLPRL